MAAGEILIVGAGPTGMTAAIELTRAGLPVRIVDKSDHRARWSQALAVQARTLEQFQRYGLAAEAVRRGRKVTGGRVWSDGEQIAHLDLSGVRSCFPFALFIPQTETETLLNGHMESMGVRAERQVELTSLDQAGGAVTARLRHPNGREEEVQPAWLLGCDGAHSTVRGCLQIPFEGQAIEVQFLLGDLEVAGPHLPGDEIAVHFHHGGDLVFLARLHERVTRVIVALPGSHLDKEHAPTIEQFQGALDRCGVKLKVLGADWMTPFWVNDRQARRYSVGRVFLAGDASHIHSPVGGQGMNTGIQDVANLAWKLAAVARGGHPGLLDSYESERAEVGRQLLKFTERMLRIGSSPNRMVEGLRDVLLPLVTQWRIVQRDVAGFISETAIHYRESPVVSDHGGDGELRAGDRFPDLKCRPDLAGGTLLGRWTEPVHLAFVVNGSDTEAQELQSGLRHARVAQVGAAELDNEGRRLLGAEKKLVIVRPDGYVGYRGPLMPHHDWASYVQQDALA